MTVLPAENVQEYPRPPLLARVPQRVRVVLAGQDVAHTLAGWRVCETHHPPTYYIPLQDWAAGALVPVAGGGSVCEWKGQARYFDVRAGGQTAARAAWAYPAPIPAYAALSNCAAVYPGRVDACFVGDIAVTAQPGAFYGGWVTPNLTGQIKGAPGTEFW